MSDVPHTVEFDRWFGKSVVVDADGHPRVVYHGATAGGFTVFERKWGGVGMYFTDERLVAASYIEGTGRQFIAGAHLEDPTPPWGVSEQDAEWGPGIYAVYLRIENPLRIDAEGRNYDELEDLDLDVFGRDIEELAEKAQRLGYDGLIVDNVYDIGPHDPLEQLSTIYVVFDSRQVKSATRNRGTYDPDDPDIRANVSSSSGRRRRLDTRRNGDIMQPTLGTIRPAVRADYVRDFFYDCNITPSDYEAPFEIFVNPHGDIVGVSTFGYRPFADGYSEASFSVAVAAGARRKGVARALVQSIIDQHPGVELVPWVVSPGMAMLLGRMGFDSDSRGGWSQDEPYMRLTAPMRSNSTGGCSEVALSYEQMLVDLREIARGVVADILIASTLKVCSSLAPKVACYMQERGHVVGEYGESVEAHYNLSVLTQDRGWVGVDPTYLQFHYKYDIGADSEESADAHNTLQPLIQHLAELWEHPMGVFEITELTGQSRPVRACTFQHDLKVLNESYGWNGTPNAFRSFQEYFHKMSGYVQKNLTPTGRRWAPPTYVRLLSALLGAEARNNPTLDSWISAEALRLSRPHSLEQRERVLQDQALMSGPVIARPPVASIRTRPEVEGDWPYGTLDEIIARVVAEAVNVHYGNVRAASRALGISHTTTMRWLRAYEAMTPNALPIVRETPQVPVSRKPPASRSKGPALSQAEPQGRSTREPVAPSGRPRTLRPATTHRGADVATLKRDVLEADSGPDLVRALDALRAQVGGVPDNLYLLLRFLEHPDDAVLLEALRQVERVATAGLVPSSMRRTLVTRIDGIAASSFDPRVQALAERLVLALRA